MHPFVLGDPARGNLNNRADLRDLPTTPWTRDRRLANVAGGGPSPSVRRFGTSFLPARWLKRGRLGARIPRRTYSVGR